MDYYQYILFLHEMYIEVKIKFLFHMYVKYKYQCNWKQSYQKKIVVGLLLFLCLLYLSILENYRMPTNYTEIA